MAEKFFKVGEEIEVFYQAPNKESGLTIVAEIYLPNGEKDSNFPDVTLDEMGGTGSYKNTFTPDAQGEWRAIIHKDNGDGQVVKRYSVGAHNVHSVGEAVGNVDGKASSIQSAVANLDSDVAAVDGKVDAVQSTANDIETKVDNLDTKVSSLDTPPMVS